jgi:hypothetical protein
MEKTLLIAGCGVFVLLGAVHLAYTLFTDKFNARDPKLTEDMKRVSPVLTRRTSVWKAWIGFNASHSLGAMLFGAVFMVIAVENYAYLRSSIALNAILLVVPLAFLLLAIRYWFRTPAIGIVLATTLILLSMALPKIS